MKLWPVAQMTTLFGGMSGPPSPFGQTWWSSLTWLRGLWTRCTEHGAAVCSFICGSAEERGDDGEQRDEGTRRPAGRRRKGSRLVAAHRRRGQRDLRGRGQLCRPGRADL